MFPIKSHKITYHSHKNHLKLLWLSHSVAMTSMKSPQKCHKTHHQIRQVHAALSSSMAFCSSSRKLPPSPGLNLGAMGEEFGQEKWWFSVVQPRGRVNNLQSGTSRHVFLASQEQKQGRSNPHGCFLGIRIERPYVLSKTSQVGMGVPINVQKLPTIDQPLMPRPAAAISPTDPGMATRCKPRSWSTP